MTDVKSYIDEFILDSGPFDDATEAIQRKAINNATAVLASYYGRNKELPVAAIALQTVYMLGKDDSDKRIDNGATFVGFNGVSLTYAQKDRTISPNVTRMLGRRSGRYSVTVDETNRGFYPR